MLAKKGLIDYTYWPLIEDGVNDFIESWPEDLGDISVIQEWMRGPLLTAALEPKRLVTYGRLRKSCAEIYAKFPEFYLAALYRLRQLDDLKFSHESKLQRWLLLHPSVEIMGQQFSTHLLDRQTLARIIKRDSDLDVMEEELNEVVSRLKPQGKTDEVALKC